jgi:anti-sigma B factor antagonist
MEMTFETIAEGVIKVNLVGRLDIQAAQQIDLQFSVVAGSQRKVIVDLERVPFLASMGIRTLLLGAKSVQRKGGRMVLLRPPPDVEKVLTTSAIDTLIPILHELDAAIAAVSV